MKLDIKNFETHTLDEYRDNLLRLGVVSHSCLVGKDIYFLHKVHGKHKVLKWDEDLGLYQLEINGTKSWSNPFLIDNCG